MLPTSNIRRPNSRPLKRKAQPAYCCGLSRRWVLRLVILLIATFFFSQHYLMPSTTSGNANRPEAFPELSVARAVSLSEMQSTRIPKIVHFIYGLRGPEPTLDLIHYLAIKSAHDVLKPDKILFHYHYMPVGDVFERARPMLTLRHVPLVTNIFGRPVSHFAHAADVVRLEALLEFGGIYLDLDLISLKPIDHLLENTFVMAQEGVGGSVGLCNAMIMARPNAPFLQRWYATYATFDYSAWNYHSVILPGKLALQFDKEVTILNHTAYFWPLWDSNGLRTLYLEKTYDFASNFGTHIWESPANKHLMRGVTEQEIMEVDNSLYCQLRPFLLDGKPDSRQGSCDILAHTMRDDKLIGHWPLDQTTEVRMNRMRANDISGNQVSGLIQSGDFTLDGLHLAGEANYLFVSLPTETRLDSLTVSWWMKTETEKENGTAVVIQTERAKLYVRTERVKTYTNKKHAPISLGLSTVFLEDDWNWRVQPDLEVHAIPTPINQNKKHHHFSLVVNSGSATHLPPVVLYMDGYVLASSNRWRLPHHFDSRVRGVWFGSSEPEHSNYQDPWDTRPSLEAWYQDIRIWERALSLQELRDVRLEHGPFANAAEQPKKETPQDTPQWKEKGSPNADSTAARLQQDDNNPDANALWSED